MRKAVGVLLNDFNGHFGELVALGEIAARVFEIVETAGLAVHRAAILAPCQRTLSPGN